MMSGRSARISLSRARKARICSPGEMLRIGGRFSIRKPSSRTAWSSGPSAQAPTTSCPRARMPRISGTRKCRSEKSTLMISRIFNGVTRPVPANQVLLTKQLFWQTGLPNHRGKVSRPDIFSRLRIIYGDQHRPAVYHSFELLVGPPLSIELEPIGIQNQNEFAIFHAVTKGRPIGIVY